jgi:hypothetical protein
VSDNRFVINPQGLKILLASPTGGVYKDMHQRGNRVLRAAKRLCPTDTGRLKQSISLEMSSIGNTVIVRVGTNLKYGLYIHEGTADKGTGYIYPKNFKFLRFPIVNNSGQGRRRYKAGATAQYAYAKRVRGIKPTPFLRDALPAGTK